MATIKSVQKELEELKVSINFLNNNVETVLKQQAVITKLVNEVSQLKVQDSKHRESISLLERRIDDLEQYSRLNDIIVSGLDIKPRTYAKAAARPAVKDRNGVRRSELPPDENDRISAETEVVAFLHSKGININADNIEACHPLFRKKSSDTPAVIIRFANRKHKVGLLRQGRKLMNTDVYLNEHLTKRTGEIAKMARYLKKSKKIQGSWTTNCKVFIKLNGESPEQATVHVIRSLEELDKYK